MPKSNQPPNNPPTIYESPTTVASRPPNPFPLTTKDPRVGILRTDVAPPAHSHHWRIETPEGREFSPGTCTTCGATRQFNNWEPEPPSKFGGELPEWASHWHKRRKKRAAKAAQDET